MTILYYDTALKNKPYIRSTKVPTEVKLDPRAPDGTPEYLLYISYRNLWLRGVNPAYWVLDSGSLREATREEKVVEDIRLLELAKAARVDAVDARSVELIAQGFEFPEGSGARFSLQIHSQINALNMLTLCSDPEFPFPFYYASNDDKQFAVLNNPEDVVAFHRAQARRIGGVKIGSTRIKNLIAATTTMAELNAVIDDR